MQCQSITLYNYCPRSGVDYSLPLLPTCAKSGRRYVSHISYGGMFPSVLRHAGVVWGDRDRRVQVPIPLISVNGAPHQEILDKML